jgi:spore cortex formation protein SpoVR/YcgB (stage V sporulation)
MSNLIYKSGEDWSWEILERLYEEIRIIAEEELKISYYPNQIEIVSSEQMIDAYSAVGMPIYYKHWSFGKNFISTSKYYKNGQMGLAMEMVINSNPCISYNMEENSTTVMALVLAHAAFGHNSVFKNNFMFKQWTSPDSIIDYLVFAKKYIQMCEERYGEDEVESFIDSCHALADYGVDKYKRPSKKLSAATEEAEALKRFDQQLEEYNDLWNKTVPRNKKAAKQKRVKYPAQPEENILYFIEKNAPQLPQWKREIIRIIRKISTYYFPQAATKTLNEGFATFTHYYIMNRLYDKGFIDDGSMVEFIKNHTGVITQPNYNDKWYSGLNPYAIGFAIFMDIKRMCQNPTDEDKEWFPKLVNTDWVAAVHDAMENYKDDTFIAQFLSPKVMRDFKLFHVEDDSDEDYFLVKTIHDSTGYRDLRSKMSDMYNRAMWVPEIQVTDVNVNGDRSMVLVHTPLNDRMLHDDVFEVVEHVAKLWQYDVYLETVDEEGSVEVIAATGKYSEDSDDEDDE